MTYFELDPVHTDPARVRREREKAQKLKASQWWRTQLARGTCEYCKGKFEPSQLTMDHIVPVARGGTSTPGNVSVACRPCNQAKRLEMPVDSLFAQLEREKRGVK